jgi:hypothetical protein
VEAETRSRFQWIVPALVASVLAGFLVIQIWPEPKSTPPELRPRRVDIVAHLRPEADLEEVGGRVDPPFRGMARWGIRGIGRDFEGHRLCVTMSPTATEEQFQAVIARLNEDPGIARVERLKAPTGQSGAVG